MRCMRSSRRTSASRKSEAEIELYASDRWAREATERLLPYANAMPNNADFGTYWNIMWKGLEASWTGAKTLDAAVNDVESRAEEHARRQDRHPLSRPHWQPS